MLEHVDAIEMAFRQEFPASLAVMLIAKVAIANRATMSTGAVLLLILHPRCAHAEYCAGNVNSNDAL